MKHELADFVSRCRPPVRVLSTDQLLYRWNRQLMPVYRAHLSDASTIAYDPVVGDVRRYRNYKGPLHG